MTACAEKPRDGAKIVACENAKEIRTAKSDKKIGAYIFPGWDTIEQWSKITTTTPYLGHYDQSKLDTVDWFVKWACEYGIHYFAFDWYWNNGNLFHNSNIEAFMQCENSKYMKFCLHMCNESYFRPIPGKKCDTYFDFGIQWELGNEDVEHGFTEEDFLNQFSHIADTYFTSPSYLQVDGKMVFVQYRTNLIMRLLGIERTREIYEKVREMLRKRGFELFLVAGGSCTHPEYLHQVKDAGFDALTAYNWVDYKAEQDGERTVMRSTYDAVLDVYTRNWKKLHEACVAQDIEFIPPMLTGFDNTPWSGTVAMPGNTPAKFDKMCQNVEPYISGEKLGLICAWNEWGEGSILEPTHEDGFGYLDVVRKRFTSEGPIDCHHVPKNPKAFEVTK